MISLKTLLQSEFDISVSDLAKAESYQSVYGGRLERVLINMGSLSEDQLPHIFSKLLGLPLFDESELGIAESNSFSELNTLLKPLGAVVFENGEQIAILVSDPLAPGFNDLIIKHNFHSELYVASEQFVANLIASSGSDVESFLDDDLNGDEVEKLRELASEAPVVNLLNSLMAKAMRQGASDMHLEPFNGVFRVRYRIDGVLHEVEKLPYKMQMPMITRLKILAGMDIAEKRRPQDGKIEIKVANQEVDIRVSALPLNDGESVVMRFLKKESVRYDMSVLGLSPDVEQKIKHDIKKTAGVVLLTGPTGSGKTTTLYTFLNALNNSDVKIITLEDPVEYQLEGVNQVQVRSDIGFDFASGLRSIVRQDPDVIMLGEIRDKETAQIALQSALTGHLVFSTVHTNDAASAYTRLLDLGVEEFLLNAALVSVVAQRLARKVCSSCSKPVVDQKELIEKFNLLAFCEKFGLEEINLRQGIGCEECAHTGYKGRIAITEYLECDDYIKALPKNADFISHARAHNTKLKRRNLIEDGIFKALNGITTLEEVMRVAG